jgi:hypothetical protein
MKQKKIIFLMVFLLMIQIGFSKQKRFGKKFKQKTIFAVRTDEPIKIDGILDEKVWQTKGYDEFVQSEPVDGGTPTEKTLVWVAYDNKNLYVAAKLYDSDPSKIIKQLLPRDDHMSSDWLVFDIDPYFDHRSGYSFVVNPSNSISDRVLYNDGNKDRTWNAVWKSATKTDTEGWTVEIKIPFNQLRFKKQKEFIWGINFRRKIKRKNEEDSFVWIPKGEQGYVSHFAILKGIKDIDSGVNLEIIPYTVGSAKFSEPKEGNPFATGHEFSGNIGLDMKIGLKSNLTMDLTFNPDFGQVEVDPAVMNLTAYETYFEEKRPFFIEGASIFEFGRGGINMNININFTTPHLFYSRRIGRPPQGYADTNGYVKYPDRTTILGAAKITGKIGNNWNIGIINSITAREYAKIDNDGVRSQQEVEPFSDYGVIRIQKEFNKGKQGLGFMVTGAYRNFGENNNNLSSIMNKRSNTFGIDGWSFLGKDKNWVLSGWLAYSDIRGSKDRIYDIQQSPQHYFQRPDVDYLTLDENATSLKGFAGKFTLNKEQGHLFVSVGMGFISPGFDSTDMGYQRAGDIINGSTTIGYIEYKPGKVLRNWFIAVSNAKNYDFGGNKIGDICLGMLNLTFFNYWGGELMVGHSPGALDKESTRGGPLMFKTGGWMFRANIHSDNRKKIVFHLHSNYSVSKQMGDSVSFGGFLLWKPMTNLRIMMGPNYNYTYNTAQWVTSIEDNYMKETYNKRYIFSNIHQKTISAWFRINWTFNPKLSLSAYIQPFISVGDYNNFKEFAKPKTYDFNVYGENGSTIEFNNNKYIVYPDGSGPIPSFSIHNPDFNYKSLRGTIVLKWEFSPGSSFYLVWTQNRQNYRNTGVFNFKNDFSDMLKATGDNIFLAKISYRWGV